MTSKARRMANATMAASIAPIEPMYSYQTVPSGGNIDGGTIDGILESNISSIIDDIVATQIVNGGTI